MSNKMTVGEYQDAVYDYMGWCTSCQEFTTDSCEPDAEEYECHVCGDHTVFGAEEALIMGLIDVG